MSPHHLRGQTKFGPNSADLILEQGAQRLHERELQIVRKSTNIVMTLDICRTRSTTGLNDIRVERSLHQELNLLPGLPRLLNYLARSVLEHSDEQASDGLALLLRIRHPVQLGKEPL